MVKVKICYLVYGLSWLRGAQLLMYNYARFLRKYVPKFTPILYDIEYASSDVVLNKLKLIESKLQFVKIINFHLDSKDYKLIDKTMMYLASIVRDGIDGRLHPIPLSLLVRRGHFKYLPGLKEIESMIENLFVECDIIHTPIWDTLYTKALINANTGAIHGVHLLYHPQPKDKVEYIMQIIGLRDSALKSICEKLDFVTLSTPYEYYKVASLIKYKKQYGYFRKSFYIGEGIDVDKYTSIANSVDYSTSDSKLRIVFIGPPLPYKGFNDVVAAVWHIGKNIGFANIELHIITKKLRTKVNSNIYAMLHYLKRRGVIIEHVDISESEKIKLILQASILVLPSIWETIPLAAVEAMVLGKPSILADIPTVRSVKSLLKLNNLLHLVKPGNPVELASMILKVQRLRKLILASEDYLDEVRKVRSFFDIKNVVERLASAYEYVQSKSAIA